MNISIKMSLFVKVNLIICLLVIPIIGLISYLTNTSNRVVENEIKQSNQQNLSLLNKDIDTNVSKILEFGATLSRDSSTQQFAQFGKQTPSDQVQILLDLERKLILSKAANGTESITSVYSVPLERAVSDEGVFDYSRDQMLSHFTFNWLYINHAPEKPYFIKHIPVSHFTNNDLAAHTVLIEVRLPAAALNRLLDKYKKGADGGPFLYSAEYGYIIGNSAFNRPLAERIVEAGEPSSGAQSGSRIASIEGKKYLISYQPSSELGFTLVDYAPFSEALSPITRSTKIFYYSVIVLVLFAFISSYLFYRNVQVPIRRLVSAARSIARGDYSTRIKNDNSVEFRFLNDQFNRMTEQIQELVETVLRSQLRLNEAQLKLLQSQIDPHFLYNSLFFIKNSARSGNEEAVVAMALNLGEYYRYSTRLDKPLSTIEEELALIRSYCAIHNLRLDRLELDIEVDERVQKQSIPRLLLQPVVENAILHGIEQHYEPGLIGIKGEKRDGSISIVIEDNGPGMTSDALAELVAAIEQHHSPERSCGLWNVRQRLMLHAAQAAEFSIGHSVLGGLKIELTWPYSEEE